MNAYVHDQSLINERRMKEMEEQVKAANLSAANDINTALTSPSEMNIAMATEPTIMAAPVEGHAQPSGT